MRSSRRNSLKSHLVTRFSIVLALLLVVMNAGFLILVAFAVPRTNGVDETAAPIIAEALDTDHGFASVRETEEIRELKQKYPQFWFVALLQDRKELVQFGTVPELYASVVPLLSEVDALDLRGEDGSTITAKLTRVATDRGQALVLYGGNSLPGNALMSLIWGTKIIYIPFTVVPVIGVFVCIPFLVGQALRGLKRTTATASSIDASRLGVRLSMDGVVDELHPLVSAINSALARIDDDFNKRQRFFANAAHELRTPIAILQTRLEGLDKGATRDRLLQDVARLAAMAEQLLDMQRLRSSPEWQQIDLVALCELVAADCGPLAISAGYDLEFEAEIASFITYGDRSSIERAVTNLIRNAIEHGGGEGLIKVVVLRDGTIEVSDEGPGIPLDEAMKVFEPFYRMRPKSTGAGLGLSIVDEVVRAHEGRISIVERDRGACFSMKLGDPRRRA